MTARQASFAAVAIAGFALVSGPGIGTAAGQWPPKQPSSAESRSAGNDSHARWNSPAAVASPADSALNHPPIVAEPPPPIQVASAGEVIGFAGPGENGQTITLVDTGRSWMAVYHIAPNGEIRLTASRPIEADFTVELNATDPTPAAIRKAAGPR